MLPSCFKSTDRLFDDSLAGIIGDARSPGRTVLGRSTGSQTPRSNLPDVSISPSAQGKPEERLLQPRNQLGSLLCALSAAIISLWSLRDPDACVSFTPEQADAPKKCKALEDYADANTHLLGFCYLNCGDTEVHIYAWSLVFGLLLQSLTVLPSHCSCGDQFLRVTWRVDFTGDLAVLEEDLANKSSGSWLWRRVQAWTGSQRGSLFDWLEGLLQKQEKMLPLHMKVIHQAATLWYLLAALELLLHAASTLELYSGSVSFKCEGPTPEDPVEVTAPVQYSMLEAMAQAFTLILLCVSLWLNSRAEWRTCCSCDARALREAFGDRPCQPMICPRSKHPMLSQVYGKELLLVCSPSRELPLTDPDSWGQDSNLLQLQFQDFSEPSTLAARRRTNLLVIGGLGIVLLHGASISCWGCINEVTLGRSGGLFDVESQLLLLGSCGRHNGSGIPCVLAACCMAVLMLAQTVIIAAGGERDTWQDDDQMAITMMDFREYQDNLLYGVLADQEVRSHVWLRPEGDAWDFADFLEASSEASRSKWRRSQGVVGGIRVIRDPDEELWSCVHCKGLPTDEGPSTVYIEFNRPGTEEAMAAMPRLRQIVPVDFLPGAFVCSLSVGRRQAWNTLSLTLSGAAMALIIFDLGFHLQYSVQGTLLKDCEDILSGRCLELEPRDRINVRSALGVYLAILGGACDAVMIAILLSLR